MVSEAFKDLLKGWGKQHDLVSVPQYRLDSATKDIRTINGALLHELRVPFRYLEAKNRRTNSTKRSSSSSSAATALPTKKNAWSRCWAAWRGFSVETVRIVEALKEGPR